MRQGYFLGEFVYLALENANFSRIDKGFPEQKANDAEIDKITRTHEPKGRGDANGYFGKDSQNHKYYSGYNPKDCILK